MNKLPTINRNSPEYKNEKLQEMRRVAKNRGGKLLKSQLKHRTDATDGRLNVVPNEAEAAQIIVQNIESKCK